MGFGIYQHFFATEVLKIFYERQNYEIFKQVAPFPWSSQNYKILNSQLKNLLRIHPLRRSFGGRQFLK